MRRGSCVVNGKSNCGWAMTLVRIVYRELQAEMPEIEGGEEQEELWPWILGQPWGSTCKYSVSFYYGVD